MEPLARRLLRWKPDDDWLQCQSGAVGAYEKATGQSLKFADWIATGAIVTLITLVIATILLLFQTSLSP